MIDIIILYYYFVLASQEEQIPRISFLDKVQKEGKERNQHNLSPSRELEEPWMLPIHSYSPLTAGTGRYYFSHFKDEGLKLFFNDLLKIIL